MPRRGEMTTAKVGERFGRLVVLSGQGKKRECLCDCGNTIKVGRTSDLTSGNTASCGCLRREVTRANRLKHGAASGTKVTRAYGVWQTMLQRCRNPRNHKWNDYGGRGISVCERWNEFANFLQDMGEPPIGLSIDRVDNDGNYEPGNCRWATSQQQAANRRRKNVL